MRRKDRRGLGGNGLWGWVVGGGGAMLTKANPNCTAPNNNPTVG